MRPPSLQLSICCFVVYIDLRGYPRLCDQLLGESNLPALVIWPYLFQTAMMWKGTWWGLGTNMATGSPLCWKGAQGGCHNPYQKSRQAELVVEWIEWSQKFHELSWVTGLSGWWTGWKGEGEIKVALTVLSLAAVWNIILFFSEMENRVGTFVPGRWVRLGHWGSGAQSEERRLWSRQPRLNPDTFTSVTFGHVILSQLQFLY